MRFHPVRRGQGSLETVLLLGGAVLVTLAILSLLFSSISLPGQVLNQNIDTYTMHVSLDGSGNPVTPPSSTCGDEILDEGESCDPPQGACVPPYGSSCTYCSSSCNLISLTGGYCGDGIVNGPEECDGTLDCTEGCLLQPIPVCGNGVVESGEECDDNNTLSGDGCSSACLEEDIPPSYVFGAKFEPPVGRILHGMGQWDHPGTGNPVYVNLLTNTSENPLASPDMYPASKLMFTGIADDASRWDPFIAKLTSVLNQQYNQGMIPHLDIALRGNKPLNPDPLDPLYGVDDEIAHSTTWDARINELADAYKAYGKPAFLRIGGEFNGSWNGYHPYDYPLAYQKIVDMFKAKGVENVAFIWCYEPAAPNDFMEKDAGGNYKWFPGNEYIDWYGLDVFGPLDFKPGGVNYSRSIAFLDAASAAGKPVMLAETSVSKEDLTSDPTDGMNDWSSYFSPFFMFTEAHPNILAFYYINFDWQLAGEYQVSGWKNADITINAYISQKYLEEVSKGKYLYAVDTPLLNQYGDFP